MARMLNGFQLYPEEHIENRFCYTVEQFVSLLPTFLHSHHPLIPTPPLCPWDHPLQGALYEGGVPVPGAGVGRKPRLIKLFLEASGANSALQSGRKLKVILYSFRARTPRLLAAESSRSYGRSRSGRIL